MSGVTGFLGGLGAWAGPAGLYSRYLLNQNAAKEAQGNRKAAGTVAHTQGRIGAGIFEQMGLVDRAQSKSLADAASTRAMASQPAVPNAAEASGADLGELMSQAATGYITGGAGRSSLDWQAIERMLRGEQGGGAGTPPIHMPAGGNFPDLYSMFQGRG